LNLLANFIDNLTHGAAIGGGFAVSPLVGVTTLAGIIIHEIPHEMGDFAILLRSGFDRWQATKAQIITGLGGILGASIALFYSNSVHSMSTFLLNFFGNSRFRLGTLWVLPFTSGAFLYVALVKTVPDLLKENDLM
jgi:zinc transporter 13